MGSITDGVGLLFKIKAKDEASDVIKTVAKNVLSGSQSIGEAGGNAIANYSSKISALGVELGTVTGGAAVAATAIFEFGKTTLQVGEYLFNLAKTSAEFGSSLYDAKIKAGLTAESISALSFAANESNTSISQVVTSINLFTKQLGKAAQDSKSARDLLVAAGLDPQTAFKSLETSLETVFNKLNTLPVNSVERLTLLKELFGRNGDELNQLLEIIKKGGGTFEDFKKHLSDTGVILSEKDLKASKEFERALKDLEYQGKVLTTKFAVEYMPQITSAIEKVESFFASHQEGIKTFGAAISSVITQLSNFVGFVEEHPLIFKTLLNQVTGGAVNAGESAYSGVIYGGQGNQAPPKPATRAQIEGGAAIVGNQDGNFLNNQKEEQKAAKESYQQAISDAQELNRQQKSEAEENLKNLKRIHELNLTDTKKYAEERKAQAQKILDDELDEIKKEREAIQKAKDEGVEDNTDVKNNKLDTREVEARRKYNAELQAADDDAKKEQLQRARDSFAALEAQQKILDSSRIAQIKDDAEHRKTSYEKAETDILQIQSDAIERRKAEYVKEYNLAAGNAAEQLKIKNSLKELEAEKTAFTNEGVRRRAEARQKESDLEIIRLQRIQQKREADDNVTFARQDKNEQQEIFTAQNKYNKLETTFEEYQKSLQEIAKRYFLARQNVTATFGVDSTDEKHILIAGELFNRIENLKQQKQYATAAQKEELDQQISLLEKDIDAEWFRQQKARAEFDHTQTEDSITLIKQRELATLETIQAIKKAEKELTDFRQEQQRKILVNDVERPIDQQDNSAFQKLFGQEKLAALQKLRDFDIAENARQSDERQIQMQADVEAAFARIDLEKNSTEQKEREKAEIIKNYQAQALESEDEFQQQKKAIEDRYIQERQQSVSDNYGGGLFGSLVGDISVMTDSTIASADKMNFALASIGQSFTSLQQVAGGAINGMLSGIGGMVQSFVLLGNAGGANLRKMTAQVLSNIAAQAAVLAIFELAKGFAALFFAPEEAAAHFASAILFGEVAATTAILGRLVAGKSFSKQATAQSTSGISGGSSGGQSSSSSSGDSHNGGAYYSSYGETTNVREEDRLRTINSQSEPPTQIIQHNINMTDIHGRRSEFVIREVVNDIRYRGRLHELLKTMIEA